MRVPYLNWVPQPDNIETENMNSELISLSINH